MPFEKGLSGNPDGRPAGSVNLATKEIRRIFRKAVDWGSLAKSLEKEAISGNIQAARVLLEYAFGKPSGHKALQQEEEPFGLW